MPIRRQLLPRATALVALLAPALSAQSLADRVNGASASAVQFTFAARPGVCGNGRTYIMTGNGNTYGSFYSNDVTRTEPCVNGPVRVVIDRAGREVISVQAYVGAPPSPAVAQDIGHVSGQQAADYLLDLAARTEGRVGRDAIFAQSLADSATTTDKLVAIARNQALSRNTRSAALSYMSWSVPSGNAVPATASAAMVAIARDEADNQQVRQQALSVLSRLEHGAGIPALIDLSKQQGYTWLAKESISALSRSGDPRARDFLRTALQRSDLSDDVMAQVIQSLGREYSTAQDAALLRAAYPRVNGERSRRAIVQSVAEVGGTENVRWLMAIARSDSSNDSRRREALDAAVRAGVSSAELVALYDATSDGHLKETVVNQLVKIGDDASIKKLIDIVKTETNYNIRRSTISRLSGSDDPRVRQALKDIIAR
jgi:HEAT repeat protein